MKEKFQYKLNKEIFHTDYNCTITWLEIKAKWWIDGKIYIQSNEKNIPKNIDLYIFKQKIELVIVSYTKYVIDEISFYVLYVTQEIIRIANRINRRVFIYKDLSAIIKSIWNCKIVEQFPPLPFVIQWESDLNFLFRMLNYHNAFLKVDFNGQLVIGYKNQLLNKSKIPKDSQVQKYIFVLEQQSSIKSYFNPQIEVKSMSQTNEFHDVQFIDSKQQAEKKIDYLTRKKNFIRAEWDVSTMNQMVYIWDEVDFDSEKYIVNHWQINGSIINIEAGEPLYYEFNVPNVPPLESEVKDNIWNGETTKVALLMDPKSIFDARIAQQSTSLLETCWIPKKGSKVLIVFTKQLMEPIVLLSLYESKQSPFHTNEMGLINNKNITLLVKEDEEGKENLLQYIINGSTNIKSNNIKILADKIEIEAKSIHIKCSEFIIESDNINITNKKKINIQSNDTNFNSQNSSNSISKFNANIDQSTIDIKTLEATFKSTNCSVDIASYKIKTLTYSSEMASLNMKVLDLESDESIFSIKSIIFSSDLMVNNIKTLILMATSYLQSSDFAEVNVASGLFNLGITALICSNAIIYGLGFLVP